MKLYKVIFIVFFALSCTHNNKHEEAKRHIENYKSNAEKLVSMAKNKKSSAKEIEKMSLMLMKLAHPIIDHYLENHGECRELLSMVKKDAKKMTKLSLKAIERDYHDGAILPKAKDECYEPKELIVHPATVVVVTKKRFNKAGRAQIVDEIEEVLAHLDILVDE